MELQEQIQSQVKLTVGYSEAENKESFMVGANVAFSRTKDHFEKEIESLKKQLDECKKNYEFTTNDLITLANIIKRYSKLD